jgi:hypothetical protein
MNKLFKMQFILFILTLIFAASAGSAWAWTASNTRIVNNATLSYDDGTGTKTVNAIPVVVTVALIPSAPAVTPGPPQTTPYTGPGTPLTNSFTVTAAANGPDTYSITSAISGTSTNTSGAAVNTPVPASVTLGATVTLAGSTTTSINVPADGSSNGNVNGIHTGSTVVIGSDTRTVSAVTDNAAGTSTITLSAALSAAPGAGILVAEQATVQVVVTSGSITTPGTNITVAKNITVTSTTSPNPAVTSGTVTDTYTSGLASLNKFVRNVTQSTMAGGGTTYPYSGNTYYTSGITANPGDFLEYILVVNNSGTGPVNASLVSDALPTSYVVLRANAYGANREVTYVSDTNATSTYSAASDADQATYAAGTLTVYLGTGATNAAGGSIPGNNSRVLVLYQTTVNP